MGTEYNAFTDTATTDSGSIAVGNMGLEISSANAFEVPGDIMSTARTPMGFPVTSRMVQPNDTIECSGFRMTVAAAVREGFLTRDAGGNFIPTAQGQQGATQQEQPQGQLELASGGTAEEALASDFRADDHTEGLLTSLIEGVTPGDQIAAVESVIGNFGELDEGVAVRLASQLGVEPGEAVEAVQQVISGMEAATYRHLEAFGVYDRDAFTAFLNSSPQVQAARTEAFRDLIMHNSTKGLEALAERFTTEADLHDPAEVAEALTEAGIKFTRMRTGGFLLDFTSSGDGQMTFKQAVQLGRIKLSRGR